MPVEIEQNEEDDTVTWRRSTRRQALWTRSKADVTDEEYKRVLQAHRPRLHRSAELEPNR
ncbi:hypothetical protein M8494_20395 [Serratia ureilytica]